MANFYIVDRRAELEPGMTLERSADFSQCRMFPVQEHFNRNDLQSLTEEVFPNGLTCHGKRYFLDESLVITGSHGPEPVAPHVPMVELVVELVRRLEFPHLTSRFESVFGWETEAQAMEFRDAFGQGAGNILQVEGKSTGRYDMEQLYLGGTTVGSWMFARRYWMGLSSPEPSWEILLAPPVTILECIET